MTLDRRTILGAGLVLIAGRFPGVAQPAQGLIADTARAAALTAAATAQIGVTTLYDPAYVRLAFPRGDVASDRGVCTDVIVRAYRDAFNLDLQALVHADMRENFARYPTRWGLKAPDTNIDHRRVVNLRVFFARKGAELSRPTNGAEWQPGDIVTQELVAPGSRQSGLPHIGIVSDTMTTDRPRRMVIHNVGAGTRTEDILETYKVTGRYRWLPAG